MSAAHLHKLHLLLLCKGHSDSISVMKELQNRYKLSEDYYKCCNYLQIYQIYGDKLYLLWKNTCEKDYEKFLKYYFV